MRVSNGDMGIWHESYRIAPGQYEAIYGSMPAFGLGQVGRLVPASGRRDTTRGRIGSSAPDDMAGEQTLLTDHVQGRSGNRLFLSLMVIYSSSRSG